VIFDPEMMGRDDNSVSEDEVDETLAWLAIMLAPFAVWLLSLI
jgi:hypothetical protein